MNLRLTFPSKKCSQQNKAPEGFEPSISCLLDRRFNQLSHGAARERRSLLLRFVTKMLCSTTQKENSYYIVNSNNNKQKKTP